MNIFAIFGTEKTEALTVFIEKHYASNYFKIKDGEWFVASNKTTNEITDFFLQDLTPVESSEELTFIIIPVSNWNGWSRNDMWEWLSLKSKEVLVTTEVKMEETHEESTDG